MNLLTQITNEYSMLWNLFYNNNAVHSEISSNLIIVLIVCLLVIIMRFEGINKWFSRHDYGEEPKGFSNTWKVYFSSPWLSGNGVCMWRIYASIPLAVLLHINYHNETISSWIIKVIVFLFITDALDGAIARSLNNITTIGKALDPLADKFLVLLILSVVLYNYNNHLFIAIGIILIIVDAIGQFIRGKAKDPAAIWVGKTKTAITMFTIYILSLNRYDINLDYIGGTLLIISFIFTFWSFYGKLSPQMKSRSGKYLMRFIRKKVAD